MKGYTELKSDITPPSGLWISLEVEGVDGFHSGDTIMISDTSSYDLATIEIVDTLNKTLYVIPLNKNISYTAGAEVSLLTRTRELIPLEGPNSSIIPLNDRVPFRYPSLPNDWKGVTHSGLLLEATRTDVKTFTSNITIEWEPVLQDVQIIENFSQMDYNFFHELWRLYSTRRHFLYRPRDLNLNEYEIEIADIKVSKQHRFWVEGVTITYKPHKITREISEVDLYQSQMHPRIFPSESQ